MLIVVSILVLISVFAVPNYRSFINKLKMKSQMSEVLSFARESQEYAINVVSSDGSFLGKFGLFMSDGDGQNTSLIIFLDNHLNTSNGVYDNGDSTSCTDEECYKKLDLKEGVKIEKICWSDALGEHPTSGCESFTDKTDSGKTANIIFTRPLPDAKFFTAASSELSNFKSTAIIFKSNSGDWGKLVIGSTGYMYVETK